MPRIEDTFRGCNVLVTGASSGIGRCLADQFAAGGARVALVARRAGRLNALANELSDLSVCEHLAVPADLCEPGAVEWVCRRVKEEFGSVNVLVNNAGIGNSGPFVRQSAEDLERMLELNVLVPIRLTSHLLPAMIKRGRGWIMNVASAAAYQPMAYLAAYSASKSFLLSFSQALWAEARRKGVTVTCVNPGTTRTEFFDGEEFKGVREQLLQGAMEADEVARIAIRALAKGKCSVTCGVRYKLATLLGSMMPASLVARVTERIFRAPR